MNAELQGQEESAARRAARRFGLFAGTFFFCRLSAVRLPFCLAHSAVCLPLRGGQREGEEGGLRAEERRERERRKRRTRY